MPEPDGRSPLWLAKTYSPRPFDCNSKSTARTSELRGMPLVCRLSPRHFGLATKTRFFCRSTCDHRSERTSSLRIPVPNATLTTWRSTPRIIGSVWNNLVSSSAERYRVRGEIPRAARLQRQRPDLGTGVLEEEFVVHGHRHYAGEQLQLVVYRARARYGLALRD